MPVVKKPSSRSGTGGWIAYNSKRDKERLKKRQKLVSALRNGRRPPKTEQETPKEEVSEQELEPAPFSPAPTIVYSPPPRRRCVTHALA